MCDDGHSASAVSWCGRALHLRTEEEDEDKYTSCRDVSEAESDVRCRVNDGEDGWGVKYRTEEDVQIS